MSEARTNSVISLSMAAMHSDPITEPHDGGGIPVGYAGGFPMGYVAFESTKKAAQPWYVAVLKSSVGGVPM